MSRNYKSKCDSAQKLLRPVDISQELWRPGLQQVKEFHLITETLENSSQDWISGIPARNLRKNYRALTGLVSDVVKKHTMTPFESSLERDFVYLLIGASDVRHYKWQPVKIEWCYKDEKHPRRYTPDFGLEFEDSLGDDAKRPWLVEIKYREELKKKWNELKPSYRAATRYAHERGMIFKILTEREIRTPLMESTRFLLNYLTIETGPEFWQPILVALRDMEESCPNDILNMITSSKLNRGKMIPHLWYLMATKVIRTDFSKPLNMASRVWLPDENEMEEGLWEMIYGWPQGNW